MMRTERSARWSVYMVRCKDGSLYSGIAKDLIARIAAHNAGKGAKYTKPRRPVTLVWSRRLPPTKARQREAALKRLTKPEKESLVAGARLQPLPKTKKKKRGA